MEALTLLPSSLYASHPHILQSAAAAQHQRVSSLQGISKPSLYLKGSQSPPFISRDLKALPLSQGISKPSLYLKGSQSPPFISRDLKALPLSQAWGIKVGSFRRINWIWACKCVLAEGCHEFNVMLIHDRRKWPV